jgi:multiple sugar transport system substrate-binding protein
MKRPVNGARILAAVTAVAFIGSVSAWRPATVSSPVNISFWTSGSTDGVAQIVNQFNHTYHSTYHINFRAIPYSNETTVVNSALTAHRAPELMEESLTFSASYAVEGLELPITPFLKMAGINPTVDFPKPMWDLAALNGVHYVAPTDGLPTVLYWNKAMFKAAGLNPNQPPRTLSQFVADAKKLSQPSKGIWGYVQEPAWPAPFLFPSLLGQFGGTEANASTKKMEFDSKAGISAVQFMYNCIYKWHISPTNASSGESHNLFYEGKNAMMMTGAYDYAEAKAKLGRNLGFTTLPVIGKKASDFLGQNYWWVFKNPNLTPKAKKGIALFMKFFYDHSIELAKAGVLPVWQPAFTKSAFKNIPGFSVQAAALQAGIMNPLIPGWGTAGSYLYNAIDGALLNKGTIPQALKKAAQQMEQTLNQPQA